MKRLKTTLSVALLLSFSICPLRAEDPNQVGEWGPAIAVWDDSWTDPNQGGDPNFSKAARFIHSILLPKSNCVLGIDGLSMLQPELPQSPAVVLLNPLTDPPVMKIALARRVPGNNHWLTCSGHTMLGDKEGYIAFVGGEPICDFDDPPPNVFTVYAPNMADPNQVGAWIAAGEEVWDPSETACAGRNVADHHHRFYPTFLTLGSRDLLVVDGGLRPWWYSDACPVNYDRCDQNLGDPWVPLLMTPGQEPNSFTLEPLNGAEYYSYYNDPYGEPNVTAPYPFATGFYPHMWQTGNLGRVFYAGAYDMSKEGDDPNGPRFYSRWLQTGLMRWTANDPNIHDPDDPNFNDSNLRIPCWEGKEPPGSSVMYHQDRILAGGSANTFAGDPLPLRSRDAYFINLSAQAPQWIATPMNLARKHFYFIALPNGDVAAIGDAPDPNDPNNPNLGRSQVEFWTPPDLFHPLGTWTVAAHTPNRYAYHSSAVLLPDGSIFIGGQVKGDWNDPNSGQYRIYKPPYFFKGPRPAITFGPDCARYNTAFSLYVDDTTDIAKVRLLRPGAATHSWDMNQRAVELAFTKPSSTRLRITAPDNPNLAPPGWYMLFVVDDQGRPCQMAHWIWLSPNTCEQAV